MISENFVRKNVAFGITATELAGFNDLKLFRRGLGLFRHAHKIRCVGVEQRNGKCPIGRETLNEA